MTLNRLLVAQLIVLFAVLAAVATYVSAQTQPDVITGADIGFRLDRVERGRAMGRLVVRVDGKWLDAAAAGGVVPLQTK
jgi:hypothetical protein